jgi:hypothetical protein
LLVECAVGAVCVVVVDVLAQHTLEVTARKDQDAVEAFAPGAADPAFRVCFRLRCGDGRADHRDSLGAQEGVEGLRQLGVAVADQDPRALALVVQGGEDGARLLRGPGAVGVGPVCDKERQRVGERWRD